MNFLTQFNNDKWTVRIHGTNEEPWFAAKDICEALGIANSRDAVARLDDDEKDDVGLTDAIGRSQSTTIVSEPGLYNLILRCREATTPGTPAFEFRRWVTHEVLPAIRKRNPGRLIKSEMTTSRLYGGERFGDLMVLNRAPKKGKQHIQYLCSCICGREVLVRGAHLREGTVTYCGECDRNRLGEREWLEKLYLRTVGQPGTRDLADFIHKRLCNP